MLNRNNSFRSTRKPHYRKTTSNPRRASRSRRPGQSGGMYLKRSQGFGGRRRLRPGVSAYNDPRRVYALIVVGCALLLFSASILWYSNRSVDITLNGEKTSVRIHSSVERIMTDKKLTLRSGNLLAVDDSVLEKGGGTSYTVKLNGDKVSSSDINSIDIQGGEDLEILDGENVYEPHDIEATEIQPELTVKGTGPIGFVETWGEAGRSEVWTGKTSGLTVDKGMVKEAVNCLVTRTGVTPDTDDGKKYVALTFDEGPSSRTEEILQILKEKNAHATFFVSGDKVADNADAVKAITESDNELGTNAYSDTDLSKLSSDDLRSQLTKSFDAVKEASGTSVSMVRPPYGEFSEQNWADAMDMVSVVVTWSVDSGDWLLKGSDSVVSTVMGSVRSGNIVLLTDNTATVDQTVEALPALIDRLQSEGYELVTISELIKTDKDLADKVMPNKATMPSDAALPTIKQKDE